LACGLIVPNAMQGAMQPLPQIAGAAGAAIGCIQMTMGAVVSGLVAALHDGHSALSMTALHGAVLGPSLRFISATCSSRRVRRRVALSGAGAIAPRFVLANSGWRTVDSQIITLRASGAEVFADFTLLKATAQAVKKAYDLEWRAVHLVTAAASSIQETMKPVGLEKNVVAFRYFIDPSDPDAKANPNFKKYLEFIATRVPGADPEDFVNFSAYTTAEALVEILKRCGNDLTLENIIKQTTSGVTIQPSLTLPGVEYRPTPENHGGITNLQPSKIVGGHYVAAGSLVR
jgi:Periplasmic binding protein